MQRVCIHVTDPTTVEVTAEVTVDNVLPIAVLDSGDPFNASLEGYSPLFVNAATVAAASNECCGLKCIALLACGRLCMSF